MNRTTFIEKQTKNFEQHVATLLDFGKLKVLDFGKPGSSHYRIRFIFEEDYCRLHISGDLGHLTASNYNNMTYEMFSRHFANNVGYFREKVDCCDRPLVRYDFDKAMNQLKEYAGCDLDTTDDSCDSDEESMWADFQSELEDKFDDEHGFTEAAFDLIYEVLGVEYCDCYDFGKEYTDILDLYCLAFRLAQQKLAESEKEDHQ